MKFIKLHQGGRALLVNLSHISEVYTFIDNKSSLYFIVEAGAQEKRMTVDESIDEILELIKQVSV